MSCGPSSYCKTWLPVPVCQGTNTPCGPSPPVIQMFSCSNGLCVGDPKGTFASCSQANCQPPVPKMFRCSGTQCISDPNGTFASCDEANCNPSPPPAGQCPPSSYCQTWQQPSTCHGYPNIICGGPTPPPPVYVNCCDKSNPLQYKCSKSLNSCPAGTTQVSDCPTQCVTPPPPPVYVNCCDKSNPLQYKCSKSLNSCPPGVTQVSDCPSQCVTPTPPPPTTVNCCDKSNPLKYTCGPFQGFCPAGMTQVTDCSLECKTPTPPPPSGTCPNLNCSQGGFPIIFWSEHPPIGTDPMSPEIIQYYQLMNNFMCNPNPAGLCVNKLMLRLEVPVENDGSRNCFYPSLSSPLYTEFLKNLPTDFELYAMPYFDKTTSWAAYPDNPVEQAALTALTYIPCNASCNTIPCDGVDCPAGFQCINGSCFQPNDQCGACPAGQTCLFGYGKKYPDCYTVCKGMCCEGTVDPSGAGTCCNATCDNALARAVYQVKHWNQVLGRPLFKGLVVDQEGSGYSRTTIATKMREAMRFLGVNYLLGTTYDGSNISHCIADLTATDDTRFDFAMPEVYNLSTQCNTGRNSWPPNTQLVDSYDKSPMLGGCNAIPYPSTNSLYTQAWKTANPAQSLWSGLNGLNFETIIRYGWNKLVPQDVANRIYPLLSVETSAISPVQDCLYPAGSGGPCGEPNALGLWNTVQGAQQFIQFVQLFQSSLSDIFMPGSGTIPAQNFGIFSFPIMPKAWFGK